MSAPLRLVLFDVDGTLVDSQGSIVRSMTTSFQAASVPVPTRKAILSIVGLSLPHAIARLAPEQPLSVQNDLVEGYKEAYHAHRLELGAASSPLYPGARNMLEKLRAYPEVLLGVATGKSRRGLDKLIEAHALEQFSLLVSETVSFIDDGNPEWYLAHYIKVTNQSVISSHHHIELQKLRVMRLVFEIPLVLAHHISPDALPVVIHTADHVSPAFEFSSPVLDSGERDDN